MGLFSFSFKREQKALNPNAVPSKRPISGLLTSLPVNYQQDRAYESISAIYTVVSYLLSKFSTVPIRVYKVEDQEALKQYKRLQPHQFQRPSNFLKARKLQKKAMNQVDEKNDLARLLQQPSPNMPSDIFFQTLFGFKLLKGEGFIWLNRGMDKEGNEDAPVLEMLPIPPSFMYLQPDPDDAYGINNWVIYLPQMRTLAKEDVILWRYPRFDFDTTTHIHLRGQSPLLAGFDDMEGIKSLDAAYKAIFANRGANGVVVLADDDITTPEQLGKVFAGLNERINGLDKNGTIAGINTKVGSQFFDLSMSTREMQLIEAKKFSVTLAAQLYNVPAGIWDMSESANNNITQYRAQVYTDKIMGEWSSLLGMLNSALLPAFNMQGYYIDADYSEVPDLQADLQRMVDGVKEAWEITPNEKRELRGYELSPEPLMDTQWVPSGYKPIEDAAINIDDLENDMAGPTNINS